MNSSLAASVEKQSPPRPVLSRVVFSGVAGSVALRSSGGLCGFLATAVGVAHLHVKWLCVECVVWVWRALLARGVLEPGS